MVKSTRVALAALLAVLSRPRRGPGRQAVRARRPSSSSRSRPDRLRQPEGTGGGQVHARGDQDHRRSPAGKCATATAICCADSSTPTATTKSTSGATTRTASRCTATSTAISTAKRTSTGGWAPPASAGHSTPTKTDASTAGKPSHRKKFPKKLIAALGTRDAERFRRLLLTEEELASLQLGDEQAAGARQENRRRDRRD